MHKQLLTTPWLMPSLPPEQQKRARWSPTPVKTPFIWCHMAWNTPLSNLGQLSSFCSLPAPWALRWERPWLCTTLLGSSYKHWCIISAVLLLEPKHSILPDTEGNNSDPAETETVSEIYLLHFFCSVPGSLADAINKQTKKIKAIMWENLEGLSNNLLLPLMCQ